MAAETLTEPASPADEVAAKAVVADPTAAEKKANILAAASFKEEGNLVSDLSDVQKKALDELKQLVQAALAAGEFSPPTVDVKEEPIASGEPPAPPVEEKPVVEAAPAPPPAEVFIWGVNLFADDRTDTVLLKFLRARGFKVKDAFTMLKNTVAWRREFDIDALVESDLGLPDLDKTAFTHGVDRAGHPVCYSASGVFQDPDLFALAFSDEGKRQRFVRWSIQVLERNIRRHLDFAAGGVSSMVHVTDIRNSPGTKREFRRAFALLEETQDYYPELAAKMLLTNVPWWYLAFAKMMTPFFPQNIKNKFELAGPSKSAETLLKYIAAEQLPVEFGGLSKENDPDFSALDAATDTTLKPSVKQVIEIPISEACVLVWEVRVLGWEVSYGAEFVPSSEDRYTVIIQKSRKMMVDDEAVVRNNFKISEPGKVVLTVNNTSSKKKRVLYRYKANKSVES